MTKVGLISNLQIVRAFAAVNVVVYHASWNAVDYLGDSAIYSALGVFGKSGVDIFFVLSGFIMTYSQWERSSDVRGFLYNRLTRIVPIYWCVTTVSLLVFAAAPSGAFPEAQFTVPQILASYFFLTRQVLDVYPVVLYGWTLEYEVVFYCLFVLVLLPFRHRYDLALLGILGACVAAYALTRFEAIFLEFWFGCLIGVMYRTVKISRTSGLWIFAVGSIAYAATIGMDESNRVFFWGLPVTAIVYGCATTWQSGNRVLTFIGAASYSIYLIQFISVSGTYKFLEFTGIGTHPDAAALLAILATIATGCLLHLAVERPSLVLLRGGRVPDAIRFNAPLDAGSSRPAADLPGAGLPPVTGQPTRNDALRNATDNAWTEGLRDESR